MHINARYSKQVASRARDGAINIQCAGTVIRNCVIETGGSTALWLFGPDAVIENNTIIVHGASPVREADAPHPPAPRRWRNRPQQPDRHQGRR